MFGGGAFEPTAFEPTAFYVGEGSTAPRYGRMLVGLLPPGRLRTVGGVVHKLLLGCAEELARVDARGGNLLDEADPRTTVEMISDYERELAIQPAAGLAERRAVIVARLLAQGSSRPADIIAALAPLLGLDPGDIQLIERTNAEAVAMGDVREVFRFFVYRDPLLPGTAYIEAAQELLDQLAQSHTKGHVIESVAAVYDDPGTLYDRDIMGA